MGLFRMNFQGAFFAGPQFGSYDSMVIPPSPDESEIRGSMPCSSIPDHSHRGPRKQRLTRNIDRGSPRLLNPLRPDNFHFVAGGLSAQEILSSHSADRKQSVHLTTITILFVGSSYKALYRTCREPTRRMVTPLQRPCSTRTGSCIASQHQESQIGKQKQVSGAWHKCRLTSQVEAAMYHFHSTRLSECVATLLWCSVLCSHADVLASVAPN